MGDLSRHIIFWYFYQSIIQHPYNFVSICIGKVCFIYIKKGLLGEYFEEVEYI
jgi:hypothetical protein